MQFLSPLNASVTAEASVPQINYTLWDLGGFLSGSSLVSIGKSSI